LSSIAIGYDGANMNGQIDEFRVWSSVVKDDALLAVCNAPIENPAAYSDLMLYYDFNQAGGDVIDRTGNGHDGVRSGFGPDGDAWGLSRGVFCLSSENSGKNGDVTSDYLTNYRAAFQHSNTMVNTNVRNRFYELTGWTIENAVTQGNITTGAHVDAQKDKCMTFTTTWDGFSTLSNHKVYQTVTLPKGAYTFTANYHATWEGQCGNSYVVVDDAKNIPGVLSIENALAYTQMAAKGSAMSNKVEFVLEEETEVSLGLLVNMNDKICMTIESFTLVRGNTEYLDANYENATSIDCITEIVENNGDNALYDLQGRKVLYPEKGRIYIKNGKKFIVK
ncbi:MAG: DUF5013 domain-containing protein, partial [Bacteroidaceae bacterium]|nr:DUF5013 domain-containing protein [Bacteroidaceae bacterium]